MVLLLTSPSPTAPRFIPSNSGKLLKTSRFFTIEPKDKEAVRLVAIHGLCLLLSAHPHFNYRSNVMVNLTLTCLPIISMSDLLCWQTTLTPLLEAADPTIHDPTVDAFQSLLKADVTGQYSLECVRIISGLVGNHFFLHSPFLALRFSTEF